MIIIVLPQCDDLSVASMCMNSLARNNHAVHVSMKAKRKAIQSGHCLYESRDHQF